MEPEHLTKPIELKSETKKPTTITLKLTIPTQDSVIQGIKQMFPMLEVEVEGETEEKPSEQPK